MSLDKKQIRYWIGYYCGGTYENQDIVADLIIKRIEKEQLAIPIVSQQRELLIDFGKKILIEEYYEHLETDVDKYLKSINCG